MQWFEYGSLYVILGHAERVFLAVTYTKCIESSLCPDHRVTVSRGNRSFAAASNVSGILCRLRCARQLNVSRDYSRHICLIEAAAPSDLLLLGVVYKFCLLLLLFCIDN